MTKLFSVILYVTLAVPAESIIGGKKALPDEIPYQAAVYKKIKHGMAYVCSGAIISQDLVISAAHCVSNRSARSITIRVGSISNQPFEETENSQQLKVESIKVHPLYKSYKNSFSIFDLAILKISEKTGLIKFNQSAKPIRLRPANADPLDSNTCLISGWGQHTLKYVAYPTMLRKAHVTISNLEVPFVSYFIVKWMKETGKLLALPSQEFTLPGAGDSGAPLACVYEGERVLSGVLIGVIGLISVYVDVRYNMDWIRSEINNVCEMRHTYYTEQCRHNYSVPVTCY